MYVFIIIKYINTILTVLWRSVPENIARGQKKEEKYRPSVRGQCNDRGQFLVVFICCFFWKESGVVAYEILKQRWKHVFNSVLKWLLIILRLSNTFCHMVFLNMKS